MVILGIVITLLVAGSQAKSLANRQIDSVCQNFCPAIYSPVCGSDGQTYSNSCDLNVHACQIAVQFSHEPGFQPLIYAHPGLCARKAEKRQFTDSGCPMFCTLQYAPVCGSNGQTYSNSCFLNSASCLSTFNNADAEPITLAHQGGCNGEGIFPVDIGPVMVS